jgi:hypothetical protein
MGSREHLSISRLARMGALLGLTLAAAPEARACKPALPVPHVVDESRKASDGQAPRLTSAPSVTVSRGNDLELSACERDRTGDTCDDLGWLAIDLAASDDQTPAAEIGFRLTVTGGKLPPDLRLPTHDVRARDGRIMLHWSDSATDGEDPFSFLLAIAPVDTAGNLGPITSVQVASSGDGGCSMGGGRPGAWLLVLLAAFWGGLRAKRVDCRDARGP